jgi:hypothetical protein
LVRIEAVANRRWHVQKVKQGELEISRREPPVVDQHVTYGEWIDEAEPVGR